MTPRTKKKANRQVAANSFDQERFCTEEAEIKFDEVWYNKPVVVERLWNIEQFEGEEFMLFQNFEGRQWLNFARFDASCIVDLVREFFANIDAKSLVRRKGKEKIVGWVRGVEVQVTPDEFATIFQLPRVRNPEFTYPADGCPPLPIIAHEILNNNKGWPGEFRKPVSELNAKYWALHRFSCTNLLPQNRNADCSPGRARLIYAIGTGMTIDLPSFIWHQIVYTFEHPGGQAAIPFGGALMEIFRRKGANIPEDMPITRGLQPFNKTSYSKSRGLLDKTKKRKTGDPSMEEGSGSQPPVDEEDVPEPTIADLVEQMDRLEHNQSADHQLLVRMQMAQQEMQQQQQTQIHLLQSILDHLHDSHQPPPPA